MKEEVSCSIIRDLLPTYIDGLGSEETNKYVKEHLDECKICRKEYERIIKENSNNNKNSELKALENFKKKIVVLFILAIVISGICISVSTMLDNAESVFSGASETLGILLFYKIGAYTIPMIALLVSWIWKKTSYRSEVYDISNVIFIWLLIIVVYLILNLFIRYEYLRYISLI
ncbi:zf-HC2 domain-containing protein [Clostridium sp. B9]|uniref:zf-HC2 domain-containing protein n=1 Tax=Clostridium sp. B9 TaxID=3423224 RepID=UPI003D2F252D